MSDRTLARLLRVAVGFGGGLAAAGTAVFIALGEVGLWWTSFTAFLTLLTVFFSGFVWVAAPHQPRNAVLWAMAVSVFTGGISVVTGGLALSAVASDPELVSIILKTNAVPALLPTTAAWEKAIYEATSIVAVFSLTTFGLMLFPDGRLPSPRWRWVAVFAGASIAITTVAVGWAGRPDNTAIADENLVLNIALGALLLAMVLSVAALVVRFRRSSGVIRQQFKWIVWGAAIFVPALITVITFSGSRYERWTLIPFMVAAAVFLASYGIAVARYRLYDIDVVISRTIVYGTLAAVIGAAYVALVVAVGQIVGSGSEPNVALGIAVTALVAVAFQPLRSRLQRTANRIVYGKKATPYEVLSEFSARVASADDSLLDRVARSLAEGTGAERVAVWVLSGDELTRTAEWPDDGVVDPDVGTSFPIDHDGMQLGRLTVAAPVGQRLSTDDLRLAGEVASALGLALRNRVLTEVLEARVEALRLSRRRLVTVQDEARRKLERDLHDGAQQQLVALKVKLGLGQALADKDGGTDTAALLRQIGEDADLAVDSLRDFARGVYPPLLEAEGLGAAINAQARRAPIPVSVQTEGVGRYDEEIEATVYFCVVEALQNITKYAAATETHVHVAQLDGTLRFEVTDDGLGFDPGVSPAGTGLANMRDRVGAASGHLTVDSIPGGGTTVRGSIPVGVGT